MYNLCIKEYYSKDNEYFVFLNEKWNNSIYLYEVGYKVANKDHLIYDTIRFIDVDKANYLYDEVQSLIKIYDENENSY